ncbi:hypothetical protein RYA05_04840 [Pseudomonas syringae pv. actinidiae]|nr:hypothetical protein [Pseudomonas syringae pv. actinidiae]
MVKISFRKKVIAGALGLALAIGAVAGTYAFIERGSHHSERFVEGTHYKILDKPYEAQPYQVDNFYWLNCSACHMFEGILRTWSKANGNIRVNKIHATSNEKWLEDSKLDTTFRIMGKSDAIDAFYDMASADRGFTKDRAKVNSFLEVRGIDKTTFWNTYGSPASLAKSLDLSVNSSIVDIRVVPTFVVAGKYKILLGGLKTNQELTDLIDYLMASQPSHVETPGD